MKVQDSSLVLFLISISIIIYCNASAPASPSRPHIIFVLLDDQGYNEVNWVNENENKYIMPTLDLLSKEGVTFASNYYVGSICSPSRAMFMTGRYATRLGLQANVVWFDTPWAVPREEEFLPQILSEHGGYTSYGAGKYHLGMMSEWALPTKRGFHMWDGFMQGCKSGWTHVAACCSAGSSFSDEEYVCSYSNSMHAISGSWDETISGDWRGYDWFKNDTPDLSANGTKTSDLMVSSTKEFLRLHASNFESAEDMSPIFLYLAFQAIHNPYTTKEEFYNMYQDRKEFNENQKVIYAYLTEADTAVGAIKNELEELGYLNNSVIFFSSDNGAPSDQSLRNYPLRGMKFESWEGGHMVPGLAWTKIESLIPAERRGTKSNELYHVTDLKPTMMRLAGIDQSVLNQSLPLDGYDVWDSIANGTSSPREEMLYNISPLCNGGNAETPKAAIRVGDMKLVCWCFDVSGIDGANETGPVSNPEDPPGTWPALFNLKDDPSETINLAADNQDIVEDLVNRLKKYADEMVIQMEYEPPYQGKDYYCADCPVRPETGPYEPWGPWIQ